MISMRHTFLTWVKAQEHWVSASLVVTGLVIGLRSLRLIEGIELATFDTLLQLRPTENPDPRIVLVVFKESDLQTLPQAPISDQGIATLITTIKQQRPTVIGLDLYRNIPLEPGNKILHQVFQDTPNVIGIEKVVGDETIESVAGNPVLASLGQIAASDIVLDFDGQVRRGILYLSKAEDSFIESFSLRLALDYLAARGIQPDPDASELTLDGIEFSMLTENEGGYVRADAGGYQMLHNPRVGREPYEVVSFTDVIEGRLSPTLMTDKIVLIGNGAAGDADYFLLPTDRGVTPVPGVMLHASITSQIISAVLDRRPLIQGLTPLQDGVLIFGMAWMTMMIVGRPIYRPWQLLIVVGEGIGLFVGCYLAMLQGLWLPLIPMAMSSLIGIGIILADRSRRLFELSNRDDLTQLVNRRAFNQTLTSEWRRALRSQSPLAIILCDVDQFKQYNDHYGHPQGDDCLKSIGTALKISMRRESDCAARYGGEEFVVLLPNTDEPGALQVAEQIRQNVLNARISHQPSTVNEFVTMSFGVSCVIPQRHLNAASLLETADLGLYEAKNQGRNQVILKLLKKE